METVVIFLSPKKNTTPPDSDDFSPGNIKTAKELGKFYTTTLDDKKKLCFLHKDQENAYEVFNSLDCLKESNGLLVYIQVENREKLPIYKKFSDFPELTILENYRDNYRNIFDPTGSIKLVLHLLSGYSFQEINAYIDGSKEMGFFTSGDIVRGVNFLRWLKQPHLDLAKKPTQTLVQLSNQTTIMKERSFINFLMLTHTYRYSITSFFYVDGNWLQIFLTKEYVWYIRNFKQINAPNNILAYDESCLQFFYDNEIKPIIDDWQQHGKTAEEAKKALITLRAEIAPFFTKTSALTTDETNTLQKLIDEFCLTSSNDNDIKNTPLNT